MFKNQSRICNLPLLLWGTLTGLLLLAIVIAPLSLRSVAQATTFEAAVADPVADSVDDDMDGIPNGVECLSFVGTTPVAVVNGSFEAPDIDTAYTLTSKRYGTFPLVAVAYKSFIVPGWSTTASDSEIEIWQSNFSGVPAYKGSQFAEINANEKASLYQDISTTPGSMMHWSFAHRGRTGVDTIRLLVASPNGSPTTLGTFATGNSGWKVYSGEYIVPAGRTVTRFYYEAVATANGNTTTGNFLDDIQFYTLNRCTLDTDGDGIVNSLDLDSDNDGIPDIIEAGLSDSNGDGVVDTPADLASAAALPDSDNDRVSDFLDLDSDNDGIPDIVEAQTTGGYQLPKGQIGDTGIDSAFGKGLKPIDSDSDGLPDYLDLDSDGDKLSDSTEAALVLAGIDIDADGLDKYVDQDDRKWGTVHAGITSVLAAYPNNGQQVNWRSNGTTAFAGVQSGGSGGLESEPLPGEPSAFLGGIGDAPADEDTTAASNAAQPDPRHKARLLADISLTLDDLMPTNGPNGTTPSTATPADVLAVTDAPDAQAVDFVNEAGQVQAVTLGILSLERPYAHDYGVCNRFKGYTVDAIAPQLIDVPPNNRAWFWHSYAQPQQDSAPSNHEDALLFHIFVDETTKTFRIDSRWTQDSYGQSFAFAFDYVFNLQIWSSDLATSQRLLQGILLHLAELDGGSWQLIYHNQFERESAPEEPQVIIQQVRYAADSVQLDLHSLSESEQPVRLYGSWRTHLDRDTLQPFEQQLTLPAGGEEVTLDFPGLLDATIYVENNGFTDKVYTGSGLWFRVANDANQQTPFTLGTCQPLSAIDKSDLLLAGCATIEQADSSVAGTVGIGRTLNPNGRPVDVSPYAALRFWAKGDGTPVRVLLETEGATDSDYYQTVFTPDTEWRQYLFPLSAFTQQGFGRAQGLAATQVKAVIWLNAEATGRPMTLALDSVSFTNSASTSALLLPTDSTTTAAQPIRALVPAGATVSTLSAYYSIDGGLTFQSVALNAENAKAAGMPYGGALPGQPLGTDVVYYLETVYTNGYTSRDPVDAPHTYYRYRVDDRQSLLVDDFAGKALRNRVEGENGIFNHPTAGGTLRVYRSEQMLLLDYDVSQTEQYAGYYTKLPSIDGTAYTTLDLLVRSSEVGAQVRIGLENAQGQINQLSLGDLTAGGLTTEWKWVQVPLDAFAAQMDLHALTQLDLVFTNNTDHNRGQLAIKEMRLTTLPTAVVVDHFDDQQLDANARGMGYYSAAPGGTINPSLVAGDAIAPQGEALRLDYTVAAGGYALWNSGLNRPTVSANGALRFWAKGGQQPVTPYIYLADSDFRAAVKLAEYVTLSDKWQPVAIPLQDFAVQGVDLAALDRVEVVWEYGSGSGSLWLDNITIGAPGQPQVDRRTLHLRDSAEAELALHLSDGSAWQATSDHAWLTVTPKGVGATTVRLTTLPWLLPVGEQQATVTIETADGAKEAVTVVLTVSAATTPSVELYLPLIAR